MKREKTGFTLVEIMAATVIGGFIAIVALGVLRTVTSAKEMVYSDTNATDELRFAARTIRNDLTNLYRDQSRQSVKLVGDIKPDTLQISGLTPYPGTEFYNWCKENGYIIAKDWTDWVDAGEQSTVVEYPDLSKEDIVGLVDNGLYENFYFRPSTWVHHLLTIKGYDDFKRKVKGARSLIGYWWGKRKY